MNMELVCAILTGIRKSMQGCYQLDEEDVRLSLAKNDIKAKKIIKIVRLEII